MGYATARCRELELERILQMCCATSPVGAGAIRTGKWPLSSVFVGFNGRYVRSGHYGEVCVLTDQRFEYIERASKIFQSPQLKCAAVRNVNLQVRWNLFAAHASLRRRQTADPNPVQNVGDQSRLKTFPRDDHRCGTAVVCSDGDSSRQGRSAD